MDIKSIKVSSCGTHHILHYKPLYHQKFDSVLKYHEPGLAPVKDFSGAYHITTAGDAAYGERFLRTFGFYFGLATVESNEGAFHIDPLGMPVYKRKFDWCGNFQEEICVVREREGFYFHITREGNSLYREKYKYVGDFKDGIAVVCNKEGFSTHINESGKYIHNQWFLGLDVYHKGFARAKDHRGWFHVDLNGNPLYQERYKAVEPFYNGQAFVEDMEGNTLIINETGGVEQSITLVDRRILQAQLSSQMVGFWSSWALYTFVKLGLPDLLPSTSMFLATVLKTDSDSIERLLRGVWEMGVVILKEDGKFHLTRKGNLLTPCKEAPMAAATQMWIESNASFWNRLPDIILNKRQNIQSYFTLLKEDPALEKQYHHALSGYAKEDYPRILDLIDWNFHRTVLDVGGSTGYLLQSLLKSFAHLKGILLDLPTVINEGKIPSMGGRLNTLGKDFFKPWEIKVDAIILSRILHDWSDEEVMLILEQAKNALFAHGKIYVMEMILREEVPFGSLLDLNMMVSTSGRERTYSQWSKLFEEVDLKIEERKDLSPILSVLILKRHDVPRFD